MTDGLTLASIVLGGTGFSSILAYIFYNWTTANCSSHVSFVSGDLKQQIEEVMKEAKSPKEREDVKKYINEEISKSLHKVRSKLQNTLDSIKQDQV